ncbi:T9SS type B sorting domain-containing protein [Dyadobacter bucti]|uniref:T9SS type B sorting domain-containing protein n=1 Tax=Dyadobacter bucti TaxID=2572203 RepID=UPI001E435037|nr:gliding motility-associated C-terminal domain-containing protein [Dyadobacter bucti]
MEKFITVLGIAGLSWTASWAQVDCANIGFETGAISGWTMTYGTVDDNNQKVVYLNEMNGTQNGEHYITSLSDGNDPKIGAIPMVAPGSAHSIRIGNTATGTHFSRISTNYIVTGDNTLFQYSFAVLLQNTGSGQGGGGNHEAYQKPGFNIQILDSNGGELPCSTYDIQLQGTNTVDGFQTVGDIQYRNWTTGAIDLRNYIGKSIKIVVTAHGCTQRGHFGYAYFDAKCLSTAITENSSCPDENGDMTLNAPEGFGSYLWNTGAATRSIKVKANLGDKYNVKLLPLASLDESCAFQLDYIIEFKQSSAQISRTICEGEEVALGDTVYRTSGTFIRNISKSNVCDSTVTLNLKVNPVSRFTQNLTICEGETVTVGDTTYATSGTYVRNVAQITGCDSVVTTILEVIKIDLNTIPVFSMVQGDSVQVGIDTSPSTDFLYSWLPANDLSCTNCPETWASPPISTIYTITVTDKDKICKQEGRVQIYVKPCGVEIPAAFSPNQDSQNEVFFIYGNSCVKQIRQMFIYNRWGQVIWMRENFSASDPANGWNGTYQGMLTPAGTYPYKIKAELVNGNLLDYAGVVNLLR